mmetsp:Transcript_11978/g.30660  ORF Transcript_11978/g.30660 Transcript_11978/m.30660 type:complete len:207 (+) Transcript_11978:352-972(+)
MLLERIRGGYGRDHLHPWWRVMLLKRGYLLALVVWPDPGHPVMAGVTTDYVTVTARSGLGRFFLAFSCCLPTYPWDGTRPHSLHLWRSAHPLLVIGADLTSIVTEPQCSPPLPVSWGQDNVPQAAPPWSLGRLAVLSSSRLLRQSASPPGSLVATSPLRRVFRTPRVGRTVREVAHQRLSQPARASTAPHYRVQLAEVAQCSGERG